MVLKKLKIFTDYEGLVYTRIKANNRSWCVNCKYWHPVLFGTCGDYKIGDKNIRLICSSLRSLSGEDMRNYKNYIYVQV